MTFKSKRFMGILITSSMAFTLLSTNSALSAETTAPNNLSFPVIAVDGFPIAEIADSLQVEYEPGDSTNPYPGITDSTYIEYLNNNGPWYAQKVEENKWQADYEIKDSETVTIIDWGDNIESVNAAVNRPFRLEITLFKQLEEPAKAFTMAELEYPSSADELQGTNNVIYDSYVASIISNEPELVVQYLGIDNPGDLIWDPTTNLWTSTTKLTTIPVSFAPELNVGGKYIFGASTGGFKPKFTGYYRVTFYIPEGSG